jgi:DNA-binding PucR family transcriptional regulator
MATRSLLPKQILERMQRHRHAVIVLAMQRAKRVVQANIRAKGQRLADFSAREITLMAEDYLAQHREQLRAEAEPAIATWPGFARWRFPPEVFVKVTKTEHSPNANGAIVGQFAND